MHTHRSLSEKIRLALRLDWALKVVWSAAPGWMLSSLGLAVCEGLLPLLTIYLIKRVVDAVGGAVRDPAVREDLTRIGRSLSGALAATFAEAGIWLGGPGDGGGPSTGRTLPPAPMSGPEAAGPS